MENNTAMRQPIGRRMKITVITLSVLLALTLTATIVLAVFAARHTGSATLSFANGVTMQLEPTNTEGATIKITAQSTSSTVGTFTYNVGTLTDIQSDTVTLDGVKVTSINSGGYTRHVAYKLQFSFKASGESTYTPIDGIWSTEYHGPSTFSPSTEPSAWQAKVYHIKYGNINGADRYFEQKSGSDGILKMANEYSFSPSTPFSLFTKLEILGNPSLNIFAGASLKCDFVVAVSTSSIADAVASL